MRTLLMLAVSACGSSSPPPPSCDAVGDRLDVLLVADTQRAAIRSAFVRQCEQHRWSGEMRQCLVRTKALNEPENCRKHLDAAQTRELDAELAKLSPVEPLPEVCVAYAKLVKQAQGCDELTPEVRATLAEQLAGHERVWATLDDKSGQAGMCASGIAALRQSAPGCFAAKP